APRGRVRVDARERQRRHARGHGAPEAPGDRVPVPPRGEPGAARLAPVVPGVRRGHRAARPPPGHARAVRRAALMPRRTDIQRIMVLGAGPIVIGQACEFDYSGTQGCRALKGLGYDVVLLNSNPATIMTDPEFADRTYLEPLIPEIAERIIER